MKSTISELSKSIKLIIAIAFLAGVTGCLSTSQQTTAYNTIGSVEVTAKTAYDAYATLVINGTLSTNNVPLVSEAYNQLQADALLATTLASQGTNTLASTNLTADLSNLASVIATAKTIIK